MKKLSTPVLTIALAGQPNVGKSTVYNLLTGQSQYVSNWPGKTCETQTGYFIFHGEEICLVDLPGTYGLTATSVEEQIARDLIIEGRPDVIVVILDAVCLDRNLYLVAELLSLPSVPLVLGLNRIDLAEKQGIRIEPHVLEAAIGIPVVPLISLRGQGMEALVEAAVQTARHPEQWNPARPAIRADHQEVLEKIEILIRPYVPEPYPPEWTAIKLLEGDDAITAKMKERLGADWEPVHKLLMQHDDAFLAVAGGRYDWIGRMVRAAVVHPKVSQVTVTDRIDRLATHPVLGLLLLAAVMSGLFGLTFALGIPIQTRLETRLIQASAEMVQVWLAGWPPWVTSLLSSGIISGVGTVLTLLPILAIFFTGMGVLEDLGYMARAAFVMDRWMHPMGLHGKSFLPLSLGIGCNVPSVMGTRMIESPKARLITILVAPLAPCSARLSVIVLLAPIFFGSNAWWIAGILIGLPLAVLIVFGKGLHELLLGGEHNAFIMELPLYQAPNFMAVLKGVGQRMMDFLKGAGTVILVVSVLLWALSTYPGGEISASYLAMVGRKLAPLGIWLGLDWPMLVALMTSVLRKENTITTLTVLYGVGQQHASLYEALSGHVVPAAALAFLAVQVLFVPCAATIAAVYSETKSWKWTLLNISAFLVVSLLVGILIYQGGRLFNWGV